MVDTKSHHVVSCAIIALVILIAPEQSTIAYEHQEKRIEQQTSYEELSTQLVFVLTQKSDHDGKIWSSSLDRGVNPFVVKELIEYESGGRSHVVNDDSGASGIGQFTAGGRRAVRDIMKMSGANGKFGIKESLDPSHAIPAIVLLLRYCIDLYGVHGGLSCYNMGPKGGRIGETRYSRTILEHAATAEEWARLSIEK